MSEPILDQPVFLSTNCGKGSFGRREFHVREIVFNFVLNPLFNPMLFGMCAREKNNEKVLDRNMCSIPL